MPAYSFKDRFVPYVKEGSKAQTVRSRRRNFAKRGDPIYLYFGLRTKYCYKIGESTCTEAVTIYIDGNKIVIYDRRLDDEAAERAKNYPTDPLLTPWIREVVNRTKAERLNRFAWEDGFRPEGSTANDPGEAFDLMLSFWDGTHQMPFVGDLIKWSAE